MGRKFKRWHALSNVSPANLDELGETLLGNRHFHTLTSLEYGDHGLERAVAAVRRAIEQGKRIALYADYDVDGTMSCVSWIWFLQAINHHNFVHYIPCRFKEGYGLNLQAIAHLIDHERADLIITMDTGITANAEAAYCKERGVEFICTDHHMIQPDKMPDCIILNPKQHPDASYQELCGCGITFVLLRKLGAYFRIDPAVWVDLLALTGMATICDVVPLNSVNHRLAKLGVQALGQSRRPVLRRLMDASRAVKDVDEKDVGFRLGPRINAVGRLEHADIVIKAFIDADPEPLIEFMEECNEQRKLIQKRIVDEARAQAAQHPAAPLLFLGGDWHPGVVGIAASKIAEEFWCPVFLFQRTETMCKGSARSIPGFNVTSAMGSVGSLFLKFGGHAAAGGFSFAPEQEPLLRAALIEYAAHQRQEHPDLWESCIHYDCDLRTDLASLPLTERLDGLKPFGHGFSEPKFRLTAEIAETRFFKDKTTGEPRHTCVLVRAGASTQKIMFFNEVHLDLLDARSASFVVSASRNTFRGETNLSLQGYDFDI